MAFWLPLQRNVRALAPPPSLSRAIASMVGFCLYHEMLVSQEHNLLKGNGGDGLIRHNQETNICTWGLSFFGR
jgi:hypothetical protein